MKTALITGITGQDGSYLAEMLLEKDYRVHGIVRRSSSTGLHRIDHIKDRIQLHEGDLVESGAFVRVLERTQPDEIYNLAAQSFVPTSFETPTYTGEVTGLGVTRLLDAILHAAPKAKVYQASTSEMFGSTPPPQSETTRFHPRSPYGVAKLYAHYMIVNYREAHKIFACNGICFNHESERRGETFVTRKITQAVGRIKRGLQKELRLGNLDAKRDWGHASDYVRAMWLMLQADAPEDYVIATGETHTIREFLDLAFGRVGLDWHQYVKVDPANFRPSEVHALCGDPSKAKRELGWTPEVSFESLVHGMVDADLRACGGAEGEEASSMVRQRRVG